MAMNIPVGPTIDLTNAFKDKDLFKPQKGPVTSADAQKSLYIPPAAMSFRLCGLGSQRVLYSSKTSPEFGQVSATDKVTSSQWFTLEYGSDKNKGKYAVKSVETGRYLSLSKTAIGTLDKEGASGETWHQFEAGIGDYLGYFRVITSASGVCMYASSTELSRRASTVPVTSEMYFTFLFDADAVQFESIAFDLPKGTISEQAPLTIGTETLINNSDYAQEMSFSVTQEIKGETSLTRTSGYTLSNGFSFGIGIPGVSEGTIGLSASADMTEQYEWGKVKSRSVTYTHTFPVKTGPRDTVTAKAVVTRGIVDVPYTITLALKENTKIKTTTEGVWRGQLTWNLVLQVDSVNAASKSTVAGAKKK